MKKHMLAIIFISAFLSLKAQTISSVFYSPDRNIVFSLSVQNSQLVYAINYNKTPFINPSELGLLVNGSSIVQNSTIGKITKTNFNETYAYRGVHSYATNKY
ncbi:MAG: glycoside hydrolase family 97 N-terminal domain-containing protein, partial [Pedobacter sp.]|nr:glycoside hydrolase family 97 N-terminal domain-containing protein [Chitinophagaceae bacterium]